MIEITEQLVTITCDKCGAKEIALPSSYNKVFYAEGWSLKPRAKKYVHLCGPCHSPRQQEARAFMKRRTATARR